MFRHQKQVREFQRNFKQPYKDKPELADREQLKLSCKLLLEEVEEYIHACGFRFTYDGIFDLDGIYKADLILMADALADIQYVNDCAANINGLDLESLGDEVHRSNMTKLWTSEEIDNIPQELKDQNITATPVINGTSFTSSLAKNERVWLVKREDGKVIKSPSYEPAQIEKVLQKQISAETASS